MTQSPPFSVDLSREFSAPVEAVWRAWTDPKLLLQWWKNLKSADIDLREGGTYRFTWHPWDGEITGTYQDVVEHQRLVFSWRPTPVPEGHSAETIVTMTFESRGSTTLFSIRHQHNATTAERDSHHDGWTRALTDFNATAH